ncbi:MAG: four helix bundle protein, partial [Saprospiraceae bacterium]|nr:four helix bundle protein [Saprospiraceae bacterium]
QCGRLLIKGIYQLSQIFTSDEKFGMTQQIRRACISITCNIAEGSSRHSGKDQARFTEIAYGSLLEALNPSNLQILKSSNTQKNASSPTHPNPPRHSGNPFGHRADGTPYSGANLLRH